MLFFIFLFFLANNVNSQQCIISSTPTSGCIYCAKAPTVTIGANTTTASPAQTCNYCEYSLNVNIGRQTRSATVQTLNIGEVLTSPTASGQTVNIGLYSLTNNIGTATTAGNINIGTNSPTGNPGQAVEVGKTAIYANLGYGTDSYQSAYVDVGQVNALTSQAKPTANFQYCRLCLQSNSAAFGSNATNTYISNSPAAGPVTIGSPSANPTQAIEIGAGSGGVFLGRGSPTTKSANVWVGQSYADTPTTAPISQVCIICQYSRYTYIASNSPETLISNNPTAGPVQIGVPTPAPGQNININGRNVYLGKQTRTPAPMPAETIWMGLS